MHVVIVDEELPYPLNSGKRLRIFNLLRHLANRHRLTLICHRNPDPAELREAERKLHALGIETLAVAPSGPAKLAQAGRLALPWKIASNLFSGVPFSVQWHCCPNLQRTIQEYADSHAVDVWQCEWAPYADNFLRTGVRPWVMMAHDIQTLIWKRHYQAERSPVKRAFIKSQQDRYRKYERSVFGSADLTITVTPQDAKRVSTDFGACKTVVVENGVDVSHYQSVVSAGHEIKRDRAQILFVGNLQWRPNADAAAILLNEVFPRVLKEEQQAKLVIVGRSPPRWLRKLCDQTIGVELHPDVPDVRQFFYRCGMLAVPLRFASGSRLKILEALVTRTPVVSSQVGAEGLQITAGEHFAGADDAESMARTIVHWIRRPHEADALAEVGHRVVEREYDWSVLADKMESAWEDLLHGSQSASLAGSSKVS